MNQRIKELLIEAGVYGCDVNDPEFVVPEKQKKFAELIIWECYQWAGENGGISCPVDYSALNEHFGIK